METQCIDILTLSDPINPQRMKQAILRVEICTSSPVQAVPDGHGLEDCVCTWIKQGFEYVEEGQMITDFSFLDVSERIKFIQIAEFYGHSLKGSTNEIEIENVKLKTDVFHLHDSSPEVYQPDHEDNGCPTSIEVASAITPQATTLQLPASVLHEIWERLIFDDAIHVQLLQYLERMLSFSFRFPHCSAVEWNRLILLWGPPGTGKTSLAKALAQKLSIRLGKVYKKATLIEIGAHTLYSKYFGESGNMVSRLFESIERQLDNKPSHFVFILIDEIESLVSARDGPMSTKEPRDALRAVNALLTALDRVRKHKNLLIFCTSNLTDLIDRAFLDRVDLKQYVPRPSHDARYDILRRCLLELAYSNLISSSLRPTGDTDLADTRSEAVNESILPTIGALKLYHWNEPMSYARRLWDIAGKAKDFSGRILKRLPIRSIAMQTEQDSLTMGEALDALELGIELELSHGSQAERCMTTHETS
ncbi:hypothetical protein MMC25_007087 [Agyrium rufum]|nr:hypothetical protein [Agyrium rufum]